MPRLSASNTEEGATKEQDSAFTSAPEISLPKGGGAIRGIGEKFSSNPVTGTGSMSVPIATSPGRAGFGPQLALTYDSGGGNGPFGFGWSLSAPNISRKTDRGLPQYSDTDNSDTFLLSGAEDLVPVLDSNGSIFKNELSHPDFVTHRYRPRIEGLFARIERWIRKSDGEVHWRTISRDNILTIYGASANSRIADPEDKRRVFSWLLSETRDDKGNAVIYTYKQEDGAGVDLNKCSEINRGGLDDNKRTANRYLKNIRYGNVQSLLNTQNSRPTFLDETQLSNTDWMFEVVFDYGEHQPDEPTPEEVAPWIFRSDALANYRAGFEIRTTRLCQRVLMFHHFPNEIEVGQNCLVRSTDFNYSSQSNFNFLQSVFQYSYKRSGDNYRKRAVPPVEFEYSQAVVQEKVETVEQDYLDNIPVGVSGPYQWNDLYGEGTSGVLFEDRGAWYYKQNLSPLVGEGKAMFGPLQTVAQTPNHTLASEARFMDLAGDGKPDLVVLNGPLSGFYEQDEDENWSNFKAFQSRLQKNVNDPNLRFIDLNGDGHADLFISEDDVFVWHKSLGEAGFAPAQRISKKLDEENGPRIVFADRSESIYLADFSGDGLTDIVRIRNGNICYWPNLGYGHFGKKVAMDNAPLFDFNDQFQQKRIRLTDIDGSGTVDIIYLHRDGVRLYFNQSGNAWGATQKLAVTPKVEELVDIAPADLLGNGTACLVWSSPLPGHNAHPLRYINLMGGQKPHLLTKTKNNLGAETEIHYTASTHFYLKDKQAGKPWVTKLPFPVQVVSKMVVRDKWRKTEFASTYSYHHGYFDGVEREFRGFGRVEQVDVESFGTFAFGNNASPYISDDLNLYQPPIKTTSWFHTGAWLERKNILSHYEQEYFPHWLNNSQQQNLLGSFQENSLPEPDFNRNDISDDEYREGLRACKGMLLRQEIVELDVDALEEGIQQAVKLFSTAYYNCHIKKLQGKNQNLHAVFMVTESEAITYNYELDLRSDAVIPDPRIAHTLNLNLDKFGNVLQSAAIGYPRLLQSPGLEIEEESNLEQGQIDLVQKVQSELHIAYSEIRYTNDIDDLNNYRLRAPAESLSYELSGLNPADDGDLATPDLRDNRYFSLDELRRFRLSHVHQTEGETVENIPYQQVSNGQTPQQRLVEHSRILYFNANLNTALPLGELSPLGLGYETYTLALTQDLLSLILGDKLNNEIQNNLSDANISGYLSGQALSDRFPNVDTNGEYWIRSGIAGFADDAAAHFYLPERYIDSFGNETTVVYDGNYDLFISSSTDPLGNTSSISSFDYRLLAPRIMQDINGNSSEVLFDTLGLPIATALIGKNGEGDHLNDFDEDTIELNNDVRRSYFTEQFEENAARQFLLSATSRSVYDFGESLDNNGNIVYADRPASAASITRELHDSQISPNETSPLQVAFQYSDGMGNIIAEKVQAESAENSDVSRWITNGKTILNNKGKAVKQYEPYFTDTHQFEEPMEVGVTPILYYDAAGRIVRTELPDGSISRVEFSPWLVRSFDANDTVLETNNQWYANNTASIASAEQKRAAQLTALHASTPATIVLDSLGREVISIDHNRIVNENEELIDKLYFTYSKLDAEGKPLWIRDARNNLVMQYITPPKPTQAANDQNSTNPEAIPLDSIPCYDIAGNLLYQYSMDSGGRWLINDATGQALYAWDQNESAQAGGSLLPENRIYHFTYDTLRRPLEQHLKIDDNAWQTIARIVYGESHPEATLRNLRGQAYQSYDSSGVITNQQFDFKGNALQLQRQLIISHTGEPVHWPENPPPQLLVPEIYTQNTEYDALNRMQRQENWHLENRTPAVYTPQYNMRGELFSESLSINNSVQQAIVNIQYDAKGQRTQIQYGNGTRTHYFYDPLTFRLEQLRTTRINTNETLPTAPSNLSDPNVLQNLYYHYDPVGNITEIRDDAYEPVFFNNQQVEAHNRYKYDALYRLVEATGRENAQAQSAPAVGNSPTPSVSFPVNDQSLRNYTQGYQYDAVGNIVQMRHSAAQGNWTRNYAYAQDSNRLLQTWLGNNTNEAINYSYDTHGSMLNLAASAEEYRMQWDNNDMIKKLNLGGGGTAFYNYDSSKERFRKRIERNNNIVEERLYLGGMEHYRRWLNNVLVEEIETFHLSDGSQRVLIAEDVITTDNTSLQTGTLFKYQYGNHLGSVGLELDQTAQIISYEEFHPYGTTAYSMKNSAVVSTRKRYHYTGMERDEESGLSYHSARYYLPWLGRWGSADPIGISGGLNFFFYVSGNPIRLFDPNGMDWLDSTYDVGLGLMKAQSEVTLQALGMAVKLQPAEVVKGAGNKLVEMATTDDPLNAAIDHYSTTLQRGTLVVPGKAGIEFVEQLLKGSDTEDASHVAGNHALDNAPFSQVATQIGKTGDATTRGDTSEIVKEAAIGVGLFVQEVVGTATSLKAPKPKLTTPSKAVPNNNVLQSADEFVTTGIDKFDALVVGTKRFDKWISAVEKRTGYKVEYDSDLLARAEIDNTTGVFRINPNTFDYLTMRHEGRHFTQLKINGRRGLDTNRMFSAREWVNKYMERGAYEFERSIVTKYGGDKVNSSWLRENTEMINSYWTKNLRTREGASVSFRSKIEKWFK